MVTSIKKYIQNDARIDEWLTMHVEPYVSDKSKSLEHAQLEHVIDYLKSPESPRRLIRVGVTEAIRQSEQWTERINKKYKSFSNDEGKAITLFKEYPNGYVWVLLKESSAYSREGALMGHCVASYSERKLSQIYSLRDTQNQPHCTIEVLLPEMEITQIKGKQNRSVVQKYQDYVLDFLKTTNFSCSNHDLHNLNAYKVIRQGKEEVSVIQDFQPHDTVINDISFLKIKDIDFPINFTKVINSSKEELKEVTFNPLWTAQKIVLIGKQKFSAESLVCDEFVAHAANITLDSLKTNNLSLGASKVIAKNIEAKDAELAGVNVQAHSLILEDALLYRSSVKAKHIEVAYLVVSYPKLTGIKEFFRNLKVLEFLELKGNFGQSFTLPPLDVSTVSLLNSSVKVYPKHAKCQTLFVDSSVIVEGEYETKLQ